MNNIIPFPRKNPLTKSDPDALCVGRRVRCGLYGGMEGIVAAIHGIPAPASVRSLMGNGCIVTGGRATVDVAFSDRGKDHPAHLSRGVPEAIIYGVQWDIWPAKASAEELEKLLSEIRLNEAYNAAVKERAAKIAEDARRRGLAFLTPRIPSWATHAIVAQHQHDDSEIQTDYFASHTDKTLLLAWSRHGRNIFSEMRKAADHAPETAHLGTDCGIFTVTLKWDHDSSDEAGRVRSWLSYDPERHHHRKGESLPTHFYRDFLPAEYAEIYDPPKFTKRAEVEAFVAALPAKGGCEWHIWEEDIEHRENYSMGRGMYLGTRMHSGWQVRKVEIGADLRGSSLPHAVGMGGYRIPEKPGTLPELEPAPVFPEIEPPAHQVELMFVCPECHCSNHVDSPGEHECWNCKAQITTKRDDMERYGLAVTSATPGPGLPHRTAPSIPPRLRDRRAEANLAIDQL